MPGSTRNFRRRYQKRRCIVVWRRHCSASRGRPGRHVNWSGNAETWKRSTKNNCRSTRPTHVRARHAAASPQRRKQSEEPQRWPTRPRPLISYWKTLQREEARRSPTARDSNDIHVSQRLVSATNPTPRQRIASARLSTTRCPSTDTSHTYIVVPYPPPPHPTNQLLGAHNKQPSSFCVLQLPPATSPSFRLWPSSTCSHRWRTSSRCPRTRLELRDKRKKTVRSETTPNQKANR